uniref:C-type lectin domain-containing protein n=1 Tax=Syphacia muris TaxID=451379 RepID=A0A0N5B0N3_9BILA
MKAKIVARKDHIGKISTDYAVNFEKAEQYCQEKFNGHLLSISNAEEHKFISGKYTSESFGSSTCLNCPSKLEILLGFRQRKNEDNLQFTDKTLSDYVRQRAERTLNREIMDHTILMKECGWYTNLACKAEYVPLPIYRPPRSVGNYLDVSSNTVPVTHYELFHYCSGPSWLEYNFLPTYVKGQSGRSSFCIYDVKITRHINITTMEDAENFCHTNFNGYLLSVLNDEEEVLLQVGFHNRRLFTEMLFPPFERQNEFYYELRFLGVKRNGKNFSNFIFSDGTSPEYFMARTLSDQNTFDANGDCYALIRSYELRRNAIWRIHCKRIKSIRYITCKSNVEFSPSIKTKTTTSKYWSENEFDYGTKYSIQNCKDF